MADYTQTTFFATKDNLASGDAAKVIKGSEVDAELLAIKNAVNSKAETGDVPSGSAMVFFQTAAPTGWTKSTANNDKALRVTSGDGGGTGGSVAFETAFASQAVSGTNAGTVLTVNQIPAHTHPIYAHQNGAAGGANDATYTGVESGNVASATTAANSTSNSSHTHTFSGTAIDLDVQYINVIVCTKD